MKIFLTGSNGYIGGNFLNKASSKGHTVYALTRKKKNKKIKNVKWITGSINKEWKEFKRSDILVHLATEGGYEKYPKFKKCFNFNVLKSKKLVTNAYNSGCKKFLIISTKKKKRFKDLNYNIKKIKNYEKKLTIYILLLKRYFLNSVKIFPKKKMLNLE